MKSQANFKRKLEDQCNNIDHKKWNRRSFLQALGLVGGAAVTMANTTVKASQPTALTNAINNSDSGDRILVIVRLGGGNDGLNTIVPVYDYDTYKNFRPSLGFNLSELTSLNDDFAIPSYATSLEKLWGDGQMKVIHGVGYENSSQSHFSGSDNWSKGSGDPLIGSGWMGRYFEKKYPDFLFNPPEKPAAVVIGGSNLAFTDGDINYSFGVGSPEKLEAIAGSGVVHDLTKVTNTCLYGDQVRFLKGITNNTYSYAGVISDAYLASTAYTGYPENNPLSTQLNLVSRLIKGGLGTKVYYVNLGGFDTHSGQADAHKTLITYLSDALSAFYDDLKNAGWDDKVLSMTISEFGRRTRQNGSGGTAHGRAACSMLFGSVFNDNGFVGEHPDLSDSKNLLPTTDFRQMYATVLRDWLCVEEQVVKYAMLGQEYDFLDLGFECEAAVEPEAVDDPIEMPSTFEYSIFYENDETFIKINNESARHIDITLYAISGKKIDTIKNQILLEGVHVINVKDEVGSYLNSGIYICRIISDHSYANKIIIR